jgi:very-short-patch-repair endonuclease
MRHDRAMPSTFARKLCADWLKRRGNRVMRFWNNEVLANTEGVLETILDALHASPPTLPSPSSPQGRRGFLL